METARSTPSSVDGTPAPRSHHGRFVWHELLVPDTSTAIRFYPHIMGWTATTMEVPGGGQAYTMFMNGTEGVAGIQRHPEGTMDGVKGSWIPYVAVDDADVTFRDALAAGASELKAAGGTVFMGPHEVANDDRVVVAADDQGAVISLVGKIVR